MNSGQEIATVNEGVADQEFTVGYSDGNPATSETFLNVKTLGRCFNGKIDSAMENIVDTVEDRIQNEILTAIDFVITPTIEFALRSINAFSGQDVTSVWAGSDFENK